MAKAFLAKSAILGCLVTTALGYNAAQAKDPELYFFPAQKWEVSKAESKDAAGLPSCTLSSRFNNGYIVQFAGNSEGFTNINIDFRQDTFEQGRKYEAQFSVPGVNEAIIPTQAFKKNLLVSDMRSHKDFSESLVQASVLDLGISDNQFRFYMTGLSAALKDYNECTGAGQQAPEELAAVEDLDIAAEDVETIDIKADPKTQDEAESAPEQLFKPAPVKEVADIAPPPAIKEAIQIENKDAAKIEEKSAEKPAETAAVKSAEAEEVEAPEAKKTLSFRERLVEKLSGQMKDKNKEYLPESTAAKSSYNNDLGETPAKSSAKEAAATEKKAENKKDSNEKIAALEAQSKPKKSVEKIQSPPAKINKAEPIKVELDLTDAGLEEPEEKPAKPFKEKIAANDLPPVQEFNDIEPSASEPVDSFVDMRNKIKELEQKVITLSAENKTLEEDLQDSLNASRDERVSVSSDNWNLERATMRYNEAERQIERMGRQLKTQKAECTSEKAELEGMLFDPQVTNQQQIAKLASLEAELEKTKADLLTQQRTYEERIGLLEEQLGTQ